MKKIAQKILSNIQTSVLIVAVFLTLSPAIIPFALPAVANAAPLFKSLIVCDPGGEAPASAVSDNGAAANQPCTFGSLIVLANNVITDIFFIAVPLATIGFGYAGALYLTAGADEGQVKKAQGMFKAIVWGFVWILVAYLLVYAIVTPLLSSSYSVFSLTSPGN